MRVNGRVLTQDYFDFILDRERVTGQYDVLREIIRLTKDGMDIYKAVQWQIDKTNEKIERLRPIQKCYEGV